MAALHAARVPPGDGRDGPAPARRQLRQHQHAPDADTAVSAHTLFWVLMLTLLHDPTGDSSACPQKCVHCGRIH